jgi:hypothetical protein
VTSARAPGSAQIAVWFVLLLLINIDLIPLSAGPGAMSEAQRRAFGGNGFFFMFPPNNYWIGSCNYGGF